MKQLYTLKSILVLVCIATSFSGLAQTSQTARLTKTTIYYGDWQGEAASGTPTKYKHHYYNEQNLLVGTTDIVPQIKDSETTLEVEKAGDLIPETFTSYTYNKEGLLLSIRERSFKVHDGYYRSWTDYKDIETYEYDTAGQMTLKTTTSSTTEYSWQNGNIVEERNFSLKGEWQNTAKYSNFLEGFKNCPQAVFKTGKYSSSNKIGEYVYDEQGRILSYSEYNIVNPVKDEEGNITSAEKGTLYSLEEYTYEGDLLTSKITSYWNNAQAALVPSSKTENVRVEEGIKTTNYSYVANKETWSIFGSAIVNTEGEYSTDFAPCNLSATQIENETNTILLSCDACESASADAIWNVFRNGVKIGEASAENGKISYTDANLKNGTYCYFIQYATASATDGFNVTTPVDIQVSTDLAAVSNIRVSYKGQVSEGSGTETKLYDVAQVTWDAPNTEMKVVGYNVYTDIKYYQTNPYPVNESTLLSATDCEVKWEAQEQASHTIYVEAVYEFGKKRSEAFAFVVEMPSEEKVETIYTLGDVMGETDENKISKVEKFYYDAGNKLISSATGAYMIGDDESTPEVESEGDILPYDFTLYDYNENKQLTQVRTRKYGVYSGYDKAWADFDIVETYEYNDEGKLSKKTDKARSYSYTWEGNNMVREIETVVSSGSMTYDITYSNFLEGVDNFPQYAIKNAPYSSNQRIFEYTYDDELRLVRSVAYKYGEKQTDESGNVVAIEKGAVDYEETWTYTDGKLMLYEKNIWKSNKNAFEPRIKKVYTETELGMREDTHSYSVGIWTKSGTPKITATTKHYPQTAVTKATLTETAPNTIKISCTVPELTFGSPTYNVLRNGVVVGQLSGYGKTVTFTETEVPNGTWSYFIQAADELHNVGINVSNVLTYSPATELPAVEKIREVENGLTEEGDYHLIIEWEAPESSFTILGYNVYNNIKAYTTNPSPVNGLAVISDTNYTFQWSPEANQEQTIYVETIYSVGKVKSAPFVVKLNGGAVGIQNAYTEKKMRCEGHILKVSAPYSTLNIYSTNGALVGSSNKEITNYEETLNQDSTEQHIDLSYLPTGVYIVKLTTKTGVETLKFFKK